MANPRPLEELIADFESDPANAELMREARRELAPILYPNGGPQYERMMRGEPPAPPDPTDANP